MILAEEILLLLTDDTSGKAAVDTGRLDLALAGALLLDLAVAGRVDVAGPKRTEIVLPALTKDLRPALCARLVDRGILRVEQARVLGVFPSTRWPAMEPRHELQLRTSLRDVLVIGRTPTEHEGGLIALLQAVDQVPKVLGTGEAAARELRRRAKLVVSSGLADTVVRKAVQAMQSATMTAVMVATTVATSSS